MREGAESKRLDETLLSAFTKYGLRADCIIRLRKGVEECMCLGWVRLSRRGVCLFLLKMCFFSILKYANSIDFASICLFTYPSYVSLNERSPCNPATQLSLPFVGSLLSISAAPGMSGDKPKSRKGNGSSWRVKRVDPVLPRRYSRADLLALYSSSTVPVWLDQTHSAEVLIEPGQTPVFDHLRPFQHSLGEDPSSRPLTKMPDWYSEETGKTVPKPRLSDPKPEPALIPQPETTVRPVKVVLDKHAVVRNLPKDLEMFDLQVREVASVEHQEDFFKEEYSELDRQMDRKLAGEESDDEIPEWAAAEPLEKPKSSPTGQKEIPVGPKDIAAFDSWAPRLSLSLLRERVGARDPFAQLLFQQGAPDSADSIYCMPYSLPLERTWYYRIQDKVQGPFSTVEMYNWSLMGRFGASQLFAWRSPLVFVTLEEMQRAPLEFWQGEPKFNRLERHKHTLAIDPSQAIKSVLRLDLWSHFDASER